MDKQQEKAFGEYKSKASEYVNDKDKASDLLSKAMSKARQNKGPLDEIWEKIQLLFGILKDWISGEYKEVPVGSVIAIIGGLLYFVSPIDLVPDFIPALGLLDDVVILTFVINQVSSDLDKYKEWKENH